MLFARPIIPALEAEKFAWTCVADTPTTLASVDDATALLDHNGVTAWMRLKALLRLTLMTRSHCLRSYASSARHG